MHQAGSYQDEGATDEFGQFNYRQQDNERFGMARDAPGHHEHAGRGKALILRVARGERPRASADRVDDGGWHNNANEEFDPYSGLSPGSDFKGGSRGSQGGRRHGGGIGIDDDDDDEDARSEVSSPESSGRSDGGDSVDLNIFGGRRPPSSRSGRAPASSPVPPQAPRASPLHPDEMNVGGASGQDEEKSEQSMGATARRARSKDQVAASNGGKHGDEVSDGAAARTAAAMADALAAHPVPTPIIFRGPMTVCFEACMRVSLMEAAGTPPHIMLRRPPCICPPDLHFWLPCFFFYANRWSAWLKTRRKWRLLEPWRARRQPWTVSAVC